MNRLWAIGSSLYSDWTAADLVDQCRFLFVAGTHTTTELICNALYLLFATLGLRDRIAADAPALLPAFIEEVLRLLPPLQVRLRIAATDSQLAGVDVESGVSVCAVGAAANRDPDHYPHPSDIDLARKPITDHLAFNVGPRFCAGAPLARAEAIEALGALVHRLPDARLNPAAEPPRFVGFMQRAYQPLNVAFTPTPGS